uniref:calcium homeostasis endoplasmic reticulum protein-like n=1 Tax=Panthera onca TaxID=9690 RepID=UPI0029537F3D|nr:calcium homeostasis endoplasmic reticulum protein-like [Panthera onca]
MEMPLPPDDQELRNVIDKLAQFVARNGPEFEKMTMEKQKDNPKFSFLFGGEFYSYYKCKLALEQQQREFSPALRPPLPSDSVLRLQFVLCHKPPSFGRMLSL